MEHPLYIHIHITPVVKPDVSPALPEWHKQELRLMLHIDSKNIAMKFFRLTNHTLDVLEKEGMTVVKLKQYMSRFPITTSGSTPALADVVQRADDVNDIFVILESNHFLTFYKFAILKYIIEDVCTNNEKLNIELEEYKSHFKEYIKRRVCDSSMYYEGRFNPENSCAPKGCNLVLITDERWKSKSSSEDVLDLMEVVAVIFGIKGFVLCLKGIKENCLRLYHSIPTCLENVILSIKYEQVQQLVERGIAEVYCGGFYTVLWMRKYKYFQNCL